MSMPCSVTGAGRAHIPITGRPADGRALIEPFNAEFMTTLGSHVNLQTKPSPAIFVSGLVSTIQKKAWLP